MPDRWFRYVAKAHVAEYEAAGWRVVPLAGVSHHDVYSVIMEWMGQGDPP